MKCFVFTDRSAAEYFEYLFTHHRDKVREMMLSAKGEAAESYTPDDGDTGDDCLRDDDERVHERLAAKLEDFAKAESYDKHDVFEGNYFWGDMFSRVLEMIDYSSVALAFYEGVEPQEEKPIPKFI
jgi:hypothetical protein